MRPRPPSTRQHGTRYREPASSDRRPSISPMAQLRLRIVVFVLLIAGTVVLMTTGLDAPAAVAITLTASLTAVHVCNQLLGTPQTQSTPTLV